LSRIETNTDHPRPIFRTAQREWIDLAITAMHEGERPGEKAGQAHWDKKPKHKKKAQAIQ